MSASSVMLVSHPDKHSPVTVYADVVGGTLKWQSDSTEYPNFTIHFLDGSPGVQPIYSSVAGVVSVTVTNAGTYEYTITHSTGGAKPATKTTGPFSVRSCRVC